MMNGFESDVSIAATRHFEDRAGNFRSNVIETLRWYCSEKKPEEIACALERLFTTAPRCKLMRCEVIFLGDEAISEETPPDETEQQQFSATTMPFYAEASHNAFSLVQVCVNGNSLEGGAWQVRLQLAVQAGTDCVWKTVLNDIGALQEETPNPEPKQTERYMTKTLDSRRFPRDEMELDYTAVTGELAHELRNPLGAIITSIELVVAKNEELLDPEDRRLLEIAEMQAEKVDFGLRNFVKLMEPITLRTSRLDMLGLLEEALERSTLALAMPAGTRAQNLSRENGPAMAEVDATIWRRTFAFMLEDLPRSIAGCSSVRVGSSTSQNSVVFQFEYSGNGIRPDLLRKVALPFGSTKDGGSGLDGPPVYRVVSAHGGTMSIGSLESATVITITVPLCLK